MDPDHDRNASALDRRTVLAGMVAVPAIMGVGQAFAGPTSIRAPVMARILSPRGVLSVAQRQAMIEGVTDVLLKVVGKTPGAAPYITVLINDMTEGGWGVAGHGYTLQEFPELVKGARSSPDVPR